MCHVGELRGDRERIPEGAYRSLLQSALYGPFAIFKVLLEKDKTGNGQRRRLAAMREIKGQVMTS